MRLALFVQTSLREAVLKEFSEHTGFKGTPVCFVSWGRPRDEGVKECGGLPVVPFSRLAFGDCPGEDAEDSILCDAALIVVRFRVRMNQLVLQLHEAKFPSIYVYGFWKSWKRDSLNLFHGDELNPQYITALKDGDGAYFSFLEVHVTDECNLNCKACNHFVPFATPYTADPGQFEEGIIQLRRLVPNISAMGFLGGEPLLYPDVCLELMRIFRRFYPSTQLLIYTNGMLIPSMKPEFWAGLRELDARMGVTFYPPTRGQSEIVLDSLEQHQVDYWVYSSPESFSKLLMKDPLGRSASYERQTYCQDCCYQFREGTVAKCALTMYRHLIASAVGLKQEDMRSKCIYSLADEKDGWELAKKMFLPNDVCPYCKLTDRENIPWESAGKHPDPKDWLIDSPV